MDHLRPSVDASIGSTRTNDPHGLVGHLRERRLKNLLNRSSAGLNLPSGKLRPVIFDPEGDPRHDVRQYSLYSIH